MTDDEAIAQVRKLIHRTDRTARCQAFHDARVGDTGIYVLTAATRRPYANGVPTCVDCGRIARQHVLPVFTRDACLGYRQYLLKAGAP